MTDAMMISTRNAWYNVRKKAREQNLPFHSEWNDFRAFVKDVGVRPDVRYKFICHDAAVGFVPGNCSYQHVSRKVKVPTTAAKARSVDPSLMSTHRTWYNARLKAKRNGVPFNPAWEDFQTFMADVGIRPNDETVRFICNDKSLGYVPGNCSYQRRIPKVKKPDSPSKRRTIDPSIRSTRRVWLKTRSYAVGKGIPFHPAWDDFQTFVNEVGVCPEVSHVSLLRDNVGLGYIPGNCRYGLHYQKSKLAFDGCPVVAAYHRAGVINDATAVALESIDADVDMITRALRTLDEKTKQDTAESRRAAFGRFAAMLEAECGVVPSGEVTRWRIHSEAASIRRMNTERELEAVGSSLAELEMAACSDALQWDLENDPIDLKRHIENKGKRFGLMTRSAPRARRNNGREWSENPGSIEATIPATEMVAGIEVGQQW